MTAGHKISEETLQSTVERLVEGMEPDATRLIIAITGHYVSPDVVEAAKGFALQKKDEPAFADYSHAELMAGHFACVGALPTLWSRKLMIGTADDLRVGDYTVQEEVGRGGMGIVYGVKHSRNPSKLVLKILKPGMPEDVQTKFRREGLILAYLKDQFLSEHGSYGVVPVSEVYVPRTKGPRGETTSAKLERESELERNGTDPFYVMNRFSKRGDLKEFVKACEHDFSPGRAVEIILQIASTLELMEKNGIVNRDIKPDNFMVVGHDGNESVLMTDFGLAKVTPNDNNQTLVQNCQKFGVPLNDGSSDSNATQAGDVRGTLPYMPPEQMMNFRNVSSKADVFAMGLVLYFLITKKHPLRNPLQPAPPLPADVPEPLKKLYDQLTVLEEKDRLFASDARALCEETLTALAPEVVQSGRDINHVIDQTRSAAEGALAKRSRSRKVGMVATGVAATLLATAGVWHGLSRDGDGKNKKNGTEEVEGDGKKEIVQGGGDGNKEKVEQVKKVEEVKSEKDFKKMSDPDKEKFIEELASKAIGAPVPIDEVRFALEGLQNEDGSPFVIGNPEDTVINKIEIDGETIIVGAMILNQDPEHLAKILKQFKEHGIEIERDGLSPEEMKSLDIDPDSNDGKMATSYQDPNKRVICFVRRGKNIVVILSYSFAAMNIQVGNESVKRVYPWLKDKPDMEAIPGAQSLPLNTLLSGVRGPKTMAPTQNFPTEGHLKKFTKSTNKVLEHIWIHYFGGELEP